MAIKFTNNASSKLTQAITADATSMNIKAEDVSKFPVLGSGDYCLLTLVGDNGNHEIIKVTNVSSDGTCTIERAQDSTTAKEWPIENRVELRITAEYLNNVINSGNIEDILPDKKTIDFLNNHLTAKDIAIGGDKSDLASARGQIGSARYKTGVDLNDIIEAGFYIISTNTPNQNVPVSTNMYLQVLKNRSFGVIQIAYTLNRSASVPCYVRRKTSSGQTWTPWVQFVDVSNIGDGITVNNGIISVPEYEGATASATAISGLVPPATSSERNNFLRGDGTWQQVDLSDYALKTELTKYLPLTGGTLTGTVLTSSNETLRRVGTNGFLQLGMETLVNGGQLNLFGKDYTDTKVSGGFQLLTGNGKSTISLKGIPNGALTWKDKNIVRSVGGVEADTSGNVNAPYLPLTGGTVTGNLVINTDNNKCGLINSAVTKGTNPATGQYWQIQFSDKTGLSSGVTRLGCVETTLYPNGDVRTELSAYQNNESSNVKSILAIYKKVDGTEYATAPTPPSDAKDKEITTASWVRGLTYKGATASAAGTAGLVPAATAGQQSYYLSGNGTWRPVPSSSMPVGAIYVQFAGQSAPADLFGGTWSNVSSTYAGLFFRAEGGAAAAFGGSQSGGLPNATGNATNLRVLNRGSYSGAFAVLQSSPSSGFTGKENNSVGGFSMSLSNSNGLFGAADEVRPVNSTIRIWKRTA